MADRVICVSCALLNEVRWLYQVPSIKSNVIYNGVDVSRFDANGQANRAREGLEIDATDPLVLFVGRMVWQKGPDLLVESIPGLVHHYPRAKFVFAGDGDMRPGLESRVRSMGLEPSVRFLGHRSADHLRKHDLHGMRSQSERKTCTSRFCSR